MKLNREKEYIAEKIYDKVEVMHDRDLRELLKELGNLREIIDLEDLTNQVKELNVRISTQCELVELIMQEDWTLEDVKTIDWLLTQKNEVFLKELVEFIIGLENPEKVKDNFKLALKTLYKLGDI